MELKGKKVIALGDRDGVPAPLLVTCVKAAGGEVILAATQCFV